MANETIVIESNAAPFTESSAVQFPARGWVVLEPGICWRDEAEGYAAAATIDVVGLADSGAVEAHFLLLP